jgi:hypothetical protein
MNAAMRKVVVGQIMIGVKQGPQTADPDKPPPTCELCGKPLEEGENLICSDRVPCSERRQDRREAEGM